MFLSGFELPAVCCDALHLPALDVSDQLRRLVNGPLIDFDWFKSSAPLLQLRTLLLCLYQGSDQRLIAMRSQMFIDLHQAIVALLGAPNESASRKNKQLQSPLNLEEFKMTLAEVLGDTTSLHPQLYDCCLRLKCAEAKRAGLSAEEAMSLFNSHFHFPVLSCQALCSCWCLFVCRFGRSLCDALGKSCIHLVREIVQVVSLSCAQAKACAVDMVRSLPHLLVHPASS
jgi:hypothetical protein